MSDQRKECCRDPKNLGAPEKDGPDLTIQRCQVCGCRHFLLSVDPGSIGLRGAKVGG